MEATPKDVLMFELADGTVPVSDWLDQMRASDVNTYDRIIGFIDRLGAGNTSNLKSLGDGISELIMDFGPGYRIYLGQDGHDLVILLIGGNKSTQQKDIATAKEYWSEYNA